MAQGLTEKWQERLIQNPTAYSNDSENNSYVGFQNGGLQKFSSRGSEILNYSLPNQSAITLIEAQNNRKIFLFYRDIQQVVILDRFSTIPRKYSLEDFGIDYAESATISPDGTFWFAEINPRRLKKIDPLRNSVIHEVQQDLGESISIMRTFGNFLVVASENGIHILDQFGNLNGTIKVQGTTYLQFLNDMILATHPEGILKIDPFKIEVVKKDMSKEFLNQKAIISGLDQFLVIGDQRIISYSEVKEKK